MSRRSFDVAEARRLRSLGWSYAAIGIAVGVSNVAVREALLGKGAGHTDGVYGRAKPISIRHAAHGARTSTWAASVSAEALALVPIWVPRQLRTYYAAIALDQDEYVAASYTRKLMREAA